ncbi:hypothetical protein EXU85_17525 [Spirosoma sp. KCTC 42546]|uniref:hypothetical protein n=1 Tax=Spirosoma sp. KCTC 42546 TaxID=2520506 RepID=UPI00115AD458|nr:hypothetical protein [Spirosoma sp. KCTC 42546]QDK80305.1 hypothetical protein EXU85_17525 [Spirosoma sp. KCTC 42546]
MRNRVSTFDRLLGSQPKFTRWLMLIGLLVSLSACTTDADEDIPQQLGSTTEKQALTRWISNYLQEASTENSTNLPIPDRRPDSQAALKQTTYDPASTDSLALGYVSWIGEREDSIKVVTQLIYALPDSMVQQLDSTQIIAEILIDLSVTSASDTTTMSLGDSTHVPRKAALGPVPPSLSIAPFASKPKKTRPIFHH